MDIEKKAVATIENVIASCDYLESQITSNDKGVSWDGCINVYKKRGDVHEKKDLYKSVRVQIKGQKKNVVKSKSIKYSVQIADLRNYLTEGGTVFFVVCINNERNEYQIYFRSLLPIDIKPILKKYGKQKSRTIEFEPFPSDSNEVSELFVNIAANMKKQMPFIDAEITTLEDLQKDGKPIKLKYSYASIAESGCKTTDVYYNYGHYVYVINDKGEDMPVGKKKMNYKKRDIKQPIFVSGKKYYDVFSLKETKHEIYYKFGNGVFVKYKKQDKTKGKLEFNFSGNLAQRIKDAEFVYAFVSENNLVIGDTIIVDSCVEEGLSNIDKEKLKKHICWLHEVKNMLQMISFKHNFNYDLLNRYEAYGLKILVDGVVYKNAVKIKCKAPAIANFTIAGHVLSVFVEESEEEKGKYFLSNFNDLKGELQVEETSGEKYPISVYMLMSREHIERCENIDFDCLLEQVKRLDNLERLSPKINELLLNLLSVYDKSGDKRIELLDVALNLSEWILKNDKFISSEISNLNYLQTIKRKRALEQDEKQQLSKMGLRQDLSHEYHMAIHLLLDEQVSAECHFSCLNEEMQRVYRDMPIFRFWNENG